MLEQHLCRINQLDALVACGDSSTQATPQLGANYSGQVYIQKPEANAIVTVKDVNGNVLGVATTDSAGRYSISVQSEGPFFARAVTSSGKYLSRSHRPS